MKEKDIYIRMAKNIGMMLSEYLLAILMYVTFPFFLGYFVFKMSFFQTLVLCIPGAVIMFLFWDWIHDEYIKAKRELGEE